MATDREAYQKGKSLTGKAIKDNKASVFKKNTFLFVGIGSPIGKVGIIKNDFATSNQQIRIPKLSNLELVAMNLRLNICLKYHVYHDSIPKCICI